MRNTLIKNSNIVEKVHSLERVHFFFNSNFDSTYQLELYYCDVNCQNNDILFYYHINAD